MKSEIQDSLRLNLLNKGVKINAAFIYLRFSNLEKLFEKYQDESYNIINSIYFIFHSTGLIYQGDIYKAKDLILWKEDRDKLHNTTFKNYVHSLRK
jgi:hypothetical protein